MNKDILDDLAIKKALFIQRFVPFGVIGNSVLLWLFALRVWDKLPQSVLLLWLGMDLLILMSRMLIWLRLRKFNDVAGANAFMVYVRISVVVSALFWTAGWLLIMPQLPDLNQMLYVRVALGQLIIFACVSIVDRTAFRATVLMVFIPMLQTQMSISVELTWQAIGGHLLLLWVLVKAQDIITHFYDDSITLLFKNRILLEHAEQLVEDALQANRSKSHFLATASHDLRQPMHSINLYLGALDLDNLPPKTTRILQNIRKCALTMNEMFDAMLDISKLDAQALEPNFDHFSLAGLLESLRAEFQPQAFEKNLGFEVSDTSSTVRSDMILLRRILSNIISNAFHYTQNGSVIVHCRQTHSHLLIHVIDTGCGISDADQEVIWQEFTRLPQAIRSQPKGFGLGLAIVRRIAKLLDIALSVTSTPGEGSCFTLAVPLSGADLYRPPESLPNPAPALMQQMTVVFIEDDLMIIDSMQAYLTSKGCTVIASKTVAEAALECANYRLRPDIVISDYQIDGAPMGFDNIQALREEFNDDDLPAIIITGDTSPDKVLLFKEYNILALHKPLKPEAILAAMQAQVNSAAIDLGKNHGKVG
jgi:signal transduction histidine kinase/CheY-like chemotaxis protein